MVTNKKFLKYVMYMRSVKRNDSLDIIKKHRWISWPRNLAEEVKVIDESRSAESRRKKWASFRLRNEKKNKETFTDLQMFQGMNISWSVHDLVMVYRHMKSF